ncbi:transmembrane channel-like protein 5 [Rhinophrynus dorsalis]
MDLNYDEGIGNSAYHDSDTLELDRGYQSRLSSRQRSTFNQNPYNDEDVGHPVQPQARWRERSFLPINSVQPQFDYNQQLPRYSASNNDPYRGEYINPSFEPEADTFPPYNDYNPGRSVYDSTTDLSEGDPNVRRRSARKSMQGLQNQSGIARLDPSLDKQIEKSQKQEHEKFIEKLMEMSHSDIAKEIRKHPGSLKEKQDLRNRVINMKQRSSKDSSQRNCCYGCVSSIKLWFRRSKQFISDTLEALQLWHSTLKVIGSKFGTSILSYFIFLKWLLRFNIFSFIVNFSFITIPQFIDMGSNNLSFSGLELLTGAGYFEDSVLYYGYYTNSAIRKSDNLAPYNMQLAYIFTIGLYLAVCFLILLFSMAKSFRDNFINPASFSGNAAKLLCSWDFSITNEKAVNLKRKNLSTQIKETLSEKLQEKLKLSLNQRVTRFFIHLAAWIVSCGIAAGCCAGVYYLCINLGSTKNTSANELTKQASTLLVPVVVALINTIVPLIYALFGLVEKYKYPRHKIYVVIMRNVLLKISIIGILCYYWLHSVAESQLGCWESYVGQDIYRLVVIDFIFALIGCFFGEFVRRIIGTKCCKKLGMPEFDIARNVLDLIYAQTLAWIGIFFSPLLPILQIIKLFIIFYIKKVSLMMNCTPPRRAWRASQMTTVFIFLLFFPSFVGVLCVIGVTIWRRKPSALCGPFRGLDTPYTSISNWIASIRLFQNSMWVVWIYQNLIESVLFFYIITLIVLIISYLYLQIIRGRKTMVKHLLEQIANEGKDKAFLIQELRKGQNLTEAPVITPYKAIPRESSRGAEELQFVNEHNPLASRNRSSDASDALALVMRARELAEREETSLALNDKITRHDWDPHESIATSTQEEETEEPWDDGGHSDTIAMIMRERQQAEIELWPPRGGT